MEENILEENILKILADLCDDDIVMTDKNIDLFETDLLDSLDFVEVLIRLEEECDCSVSPSEIERSDVNTPQKLVDFVKARKTEE
ncbi:MAG: D-alanine--poly(phosphoribitol) ligase subunit DltC [Oscillospiraceae bacterium]|jgi:D-alanine--poly(phosphoribitol) ligase subunit 2|nr:D-alanine--poly(phosphoribitol) ligase subunit DltC [Oscillospiraceae bacterium]